MFEVDENRQKKRWARVPRMETDDRVVGVLGLGNVGQAVAAKIAALGFPVLGWSRSQKTISGIECLAGESGFGELLSRSTILVNALPLTSETKGILSAETFDRMLRGSFIINIGRGAHLNIPDLLKALDDGQLTRAALDVFENEPLAEDDPLWIHPKLEVTPHIAAATNLRTASRQVIENLRRMERGEPFINVVDRTLGY